MGVIVIQGGTDAKMRHVSLLSSTLRRISVHHLHDHLDEETSGACCQNESCKPHGNEKRET